MDLSMSLAVRGSCTFLPLSHTEMTTEKRLFAKHLSAGT